MEAVGRWFACWTAVLDEALEGDAGVSHGYATGPSLPPSGKLGDAAAAGAAAEEVTLVLGAAAGPTPFWPVPG